MYNIDFAPPVNEIKSLSLKKGFRFEILPNVFISSRKVTNWGNTITNTKKIIPALIGGCDGLIKQFGIHWNGDVVLCCVDFDGKTVMGDVKNTPLIDIILGDYANKIRKNFKRGIIIHPYCKLCRGGTTIKTWLYRQVGSLLVYKLGYKYIDA